MASTTHFVLILVLIVGSVGGELASLASAAGGSRAPGGESELTTTATTLRSVGGLTRTPPGSASASELMAAGGNCSSWDCKLCVTESIGSCLAHTLTCLNPRTVLMCFVGKFITIERCLDTGELTTMSGSAGGNAGKLTSPRPVGGTTSGVSTVLSINCSNNCMRCLLENIASCSIDATMCVDPWEFLMCLVDNFSAFKKCIGTA